MKSFVFLSVLVLATSIVYAHDHETHNEHANHEHHQVSNQHKREIKLEQAEHPAKDVLIEQCWVRLMPEGLPSGGFFSLKNNADHALTLVDVRSDYLNNIEMHETGKTPKGHSMRAVDYVKVEAQEVFEFKPGAHHIMFEPKHTEVQVGDQIEIEFVFKDGQVAQAECLLKEPKALGYDK